MAGCVEGCKVVAVVDAGNENAPIAALRHDRVCLVLPTPRRAGGDQLSSNQGGGQQSRGLERLRHMVMSVTRSPQSACTGTEDLFQQFSELVIAQRAETDQDGKSPETLHRVPH